MSAAVDIALRWHVAEDPGNATFSAGGGVTALIGPSGVGKSTLARLIAGLSQPTEGHVRVNGETLYDSAAGVNVSAYKRGIALVPQDSALFPHLSVKANIGFGAKIAEAEIARYAEEAGIGHLMDRRPHTLSGGEARRVAIVRALATQPKLLILDEPMTGLDPVRRRDLMTLIRTSARLSGVPVILITHQIEEMLFAADDAVLMAPARTVTSGPIETVLAHAETARLLNIDDAGSLIEATVGGRQDGLISCCNGNTSLMLPDDGEPEGCRLRLRVLGRDVALSKHALEDVSILNQIECRIAGVTERPSGYDIALETADGVQLKSRITMRSYKALNLKEGDTVFALIKAVAVKEMLVEG